MANKTTYFELIKPTDAEYGDVADLNHNMDVIDNELHKRGKTVNGVEPDESGDYKVDEVQFAHQIVADDAQQSSGEYIFRTTGGDASLSDGDAKLVSLFGRSLHTGATPESLNMSVNAVPRGEGEESIVASINRDTFVAYVLSSGTITLSYTDAWSANPSLYGVTVEGTPVAGDSIVIVYVKEERGLITNSDPDKFISTGWNLYNHTVGYAKVKKYSSNYGFLCGGTYTKLEFAATLEGEKTTITPASGYFTVPSDGYIFVTGGNNTNTYILMTWSDWGSGYEGSFKAYEESVIDFSTIMTNFPYGLLQVGGHADEINLGMGKAVSRIERLAYTAENLAAAKASGREWEADTNYIYIVREVAIEYATTVSGNFTACDHGEEIIDGTTVPVYVQTLYGQNLVDKLRTDVVTKSQDIVDNQNSNDATKVLSAKQGKNLGGRVSAIERHTRLTDFSLTDLQSAVADQNLAKYGLHVGDYKTINGYDYVIAGLNVMKGTHDYTCKYNHVGLIVIPHATCKWNASGSTAKTSDGSDNRGGGYKNCDLHKYLVDTVLPHAQTDLGSAHLYQHKKLLSSAVNTTGYNRFGTNSGCVSGWEWVDCYISALTEAQVFGGDHWSSSGYDTGEANTLLPVFAEFKHTDIFGGEYPWLRNISSASQACFATSDGSAYGEFGVSAALCVAGLILYH